MLSCGLMSTPAASSRVIISTADSWGPLVTGLAVVTAPRPPRPPAPLASVASAEGAGTGAAPRPPAPGAPAPRPPPPPARPPGGAGGASDAPALALPTAMYSAVRPYTSQ